MPGVVVFHSVREALNAGYEVLRPPTEFGYLCRTRTARGWAMAEIHLSPARRERA